MSGKTLRFALLVAVGLTLVVTASASAASQTITATNGPLTSIYLGDDLNCQADHLGDTSHEFFSGVPGACGTFLQTGGAMYGPDSIPAGPGYPDSYVNRVQTPVTGLGTAASPYTVVTDVDAGVTGLHVKQTDSYIDVAGQEVYRTDVVVSNTTGAPITATLYHAADCYLGDSDSGYGYYDAATGGIYCTKNAGNMPADRLEGFVPLSAGSHYFESRYSTVWGALDPTAGTQLPDTVDADIQQDNGAGLSWALTVPAGGSVTRSLVTSFSPTGVIPDTTPPVLTLDTPGDGSSTSDTTPTYSGTAGTATGDLDPITVRIYSGTGTGGTLVQTRTVSQSSGTWTVDGSPALVPGTYTAQASQSDAAANVGYSAAHTFTIVSGPAVTLDTPADGAVTSDTTPTYSGAAGNLAGDGASVTVKIYAGATASGSPVQTRVAMRSGATWTIDGSPALADGTYTATAEQADASTTVVTPPHTFRIDTTPPAVTLVTPSNGALTNDTTPTYSGAAGNATGDGASVTVEIYAGATVSGSPVQTRVATRSGATWTIDGSPALAEGVYTARAQQTDSAGNTGTSSSNTFTVDTTPPAVTLVTPADGALTTDTTPTYSGTAGNATGDGASVSVKIYAGATASGSPVQTRVATRSGTSWTIDGSPALADGTYTAVAEQSDTAGNTGTSSPHTFRIDTTPPAVTLVTPADGARTNDTTPTYSGAAGNATGDGASVTVEIYAGTTVSGSPVQTRVATRSGATWTIDGSPALAEGVYTARAQQTDTAGNTGTTGPHTFTVDTTAPTVTLDVPADGSSTADTTPTLSGTAGDGAGDAATVSVRIYAGTTASGAPVQTLAAPRSGTSWTVDAAALAPGTYTATATQADTAGNSTTSSPHTFTVLAGDTTPPAVTITAPADGSSTTDTTPTISGTAGTAADDGTTVTVRLYTGSAATGTPVLVLTTARSAGSWAVDVATGLAAGTYTARAEQTDAAGNLGLSNTTTFTVVVPDDTHVNGPPSVLGLARLCGTKARGFCVGIQVGLAADRAPGNASWKLTATITTGAGARAAKTRTITVSSASKRFTKPGIVKTRLKFRTSVYDQLRRALRSGGKVKLKLVTLYRPDTGTAVRFISPVRLKA